VFALLVFEMALFVSLIIPMPFTMKRKLFTFISSSPLVAKVQYGMKVSKRKHSGDSQQAMLTLTRSLSSSSSSSSSTR